MNYFFDMDGTLAVYHWWVYTTPGGEPWWKKIAGTHYYANLPPHQKMLEFVKDQLREDPESVYLLTSVGVMEEAAYYEHVLDKSKWVMSYLPELLPDHFLVVKPRNPEEGTMSKVHKAEEVLHRSLCDTDYLYDDFNPNLEEWKTGGGTPVKVLNGINHARKDMKCFDIRY